MLMTAGVDTYKMERAGTLPVRYIAPEVFKTKLFSVKTDVWAFGVTMWEIMSFVSCMLCRRSINDWQLRRDAVLVPGGRAQRRQGIRPVRQAPGAARGL